MKRLIFWSFCVLLMTTACHKDDTGSDNPITGDIKKLPGTIYYKWADEGVFKFEPATAQRSLLLPDEIERNDWDVSWDNQLVLECKDVPGDYGASQFTISKIADGTVMNQFIYYASEGDIATGKLAPNGQMIAINPTFHDGIVITDLDGNVIQHIQNVDNEKITEAPAWMPDNTLLFAHKHYLLKTNRQFTNVSVVKEFDFNAWGKPIASKDGKKIAFVASKHIWLMRADGSNVKQVTTSSAEETNPQFSPDGRFLLIGTDAHVTGPFGSIFYLKAIPADGQQYQVDDGQESKGVIPIIPTGKNKLEAGDGHMAWR